MYAAGVRVSGFWSTVKMLLLQPADAFLKVTRPSFFEGVPSYFEALWCPHLYFYRKSNT